MNPPTYLQEKNSHSRDSHIVFDEGPHIYTIDGESNYTSVTTWNHSHFPHFDADKVIKNMMKSKKWPQSEYYGMKPFEIKKKWRENGKKASAAGTQMHYDIECYYNDMEVEIPEDCVEFDYFLAFERDHGSKLEPYRTEWMVWDKDLRLAGSIDMIFEKPNGHLSLYDWKRCKEIKKTNNFENATTKCIEHLPNSNYWHYSLQLNTYKYLLEKNYGKIVDEMYLVCLHPNNKNNSYQRIKVADLQEEIGELMTLRLSSL